MTHKMKLNGAPFAAIKSGSKDIEMRLYDEKRRIISPGDTIEFTNNADGEVICVRVLGLHIYERFDELYSLFDKSRLGYKPSESAAPSDMEQYYSIENIKKYGVVGIEISLKPR